MREKKALPYYEKVRGTVLLNSSMMIPNHVGNIYDVVSYDYPASSTVFVGLQ